jgi:carboxyl-terminal processing protease
MNLRAITLLGIITSMVTGVTIGVILARGEARNSAPSDADTLAAVFRHVSANYVDEVSSEQLIDDALRGMIGGLDRHSRYLDTAYYGALQTDATGHFSGIGVQLALVDGYFTIIEVLDGTPAAAADVQPGDRLVAVDGTSLRGKRLSQVSAMLRGEARTQVALTLRGAEGDNRRVQLTRLDIELPSVTHRWLAPGYLYLGITRFHRHTHRQMLSALESLDAPPLGMVLDLRGNPGGLLGASVDVAGEFLDGGLIVRTEGRNAADSRRYEAPAGGALTEPALVVLIDGGAASASEVVAGALRDHRRAILMGSTTFGKGSVQSVLTLPGERGVKLTTAHYFTPSGDRIHERGIEPTRVWNGESAALVDAALELLMTSQHPQNARMEIAPPGE